MSGLLIAIDGVDGSGKSTLANAVGRALEANQFPFKIYGYPTKTGSVGKLIRRVFTGEEKVDIAAMCHLMTADAIDTERALRADLEADTLVIMDRYTVTSSWAYQTEAHKLDDVLRTVGPQRLTPPDAVFILDVPTDMAIGRIQARGGKDGYYENVDRAEFDRRRNKYLAYQLMNPFNTVLLDGTQKTEANATVILQIIESVVNLRKVGRN